MKTFLLCALATVAIACTQAAAQTLTEHSLGHVKVTGPATGPRLFSPSGDNMAVREKVGERERYVTLSGAGELFDELGPGASWVQGRIVYYGRIGKRFYLVDGTSKLPIDGKPTSPTGSARPWLSRDRTHYAAFSSDGRKVSWYQDRKKKAQTFDRLALLLVNGGAGVPAFVAYKKCQLVVAGLPSVANEEWDMIDSVYADVTGKEALIYGKKASLPYLKRNGKTIFREAIQGLYTGGSLADWYAIVERPIEDQPSMTLIKNGEAISTADVDSTRQLFHLSPNGLAWAWYILDEDYVGVTIRHSHGKEIHVSQIPLGFTFSDDGSRHAYFLRSADAATIHPVIDGQAQSIASVAVKSGSFAFGPNGAYAYVPVKDGKESVVTHLGTGPWFDSISQVLFLPDGTPAYAASNSDGRFIVVGEKVLNAPVDDLHFVSTLRLAGSTIEVMGTRGNEVVAISVKN